MHLPRPLALLFLVPILLALPLRTSALELTLKLEPGMALAVTQPQSAYFAAGGAGMIKGALGLAGAFDLQITVGLLGLPAVNDAPPGLAWIIGGGARVQRPHGAGQFFPWLDADAFYTRTGALNRFGYAVGFGIHFPLGSARALWVGPFIRYLQIVEPDRAGYDSRDAKVVMVGLAGEYGRSHRLAPPPPEDRDGDGIPDAVDKCPDKAEDFDGWKDADGCPDPDNDGDGIPDVKDKCPNKAEDRDGFEDEDGCPELDNDGDGVTDAKDKCPTVAEDRDGFEDGDGCPETDNDNDGVPDAEDKCPGLAGEKATGGCPDRDGDGIADPDDACPEAAGGADHHGCPSYPDITVGKSKIELGKKLLFAKDGTRVMPRSLPVLDEVVLVLKASPSLRLRIEGHTDDVGTPAHIEALATARAEAVRSYLISQGVAPERLETKGRGATAPIDTNKTAAGRDNNARVELIIASDGSGK